MKTKLTLLLFASAALFFASCTKYPPASDRLLEDLAILTQYDVNATFNLYKTYSISDTIIRIEEDKKTPITDGNATAIINQIAKNMENRGFKKPTPPQLPDVGITVVYFQNTTVYAYYPYSYWGYPYYGYSWYYPYYPVYYASYTKGTANIQLVDLKFPRPDKSLYIRWNAYIRGLLTGTHTQADITNAIDKAFEQTPQLVTTPE